MRGTLRKRQRLPSPDKTPLQPAERASNPGQSTPTDPLRPISTVPASTRTPPTNGGIPVRDRRTERQAVALLYASQIRGAGAASSGIITYVPLITGGVIEEWGPPRHALDEVQRQIRELNACVREDDDYVVDIAFRTWHNFREPEMPYGVTPGPVGRTQRRFIVWHSVPKGFETPAQVRRWLVSVLPETERLVREHLPRRSRAYPVEHLAEEVAALRRHLVSLDE